MSVKTEGQHPGEFLVSEGPGAISREVGILTSGQVVTDGRAVKLTAGKLVVAAGTNTDGVSTETDIIGFVVGDHDATAAEKKGVVYITRLAEVKAANVTLHAVAGGGAANATLAVKNAMAARHVILR